ncbi:AsmA family protein [Photobacterium toruni]|uniref:Putative assembly protein n=1 Tax=Photobacterium toruni TaxID=1935446 RepID=A0A1T4U2J9_9GAMM|nr:AsmA family protein [Photobacterium toruni]SKA46936.1 putative assembly protein [Photobacterium toruni]
MRFFSKFVLVFMLIIVVSLTTLIGLLHTRYNEPLLNLVLAQISPYQVFAKKIDYDIRSPYHITFEHAEITQHQQVFINADSIQLWLSKSSFTDHKLVFDSVQLNNITAVNMPLFSQSPPITVKRLILNNTNIHTPEFKIKHGVIEMDNWQTPQPNTSWWQSFNGSFKMNATSVKWHQLQLQQLLINAKKHDQQWQFDGISGRWHQATFTAQAQLDNHNHSLTVDQLTISRFHLQDQQLLNTWRQQFSQPMPMLKTIKFNRVDVVNSSIELPQWGADDINLSLENWQWPLTYWQQQNSRLSFSARHAQWQQLNFEQPLAELQFMPQQIISHGISAHMMDGAVRIDGWIDPQQLFINQFKASGIKWFVSKDWSQKWQQWQQQYTDIIVKKLSINNSQITSSASAIPLQLAGIDIDAQDTVLKQNNQWGLWQGNIEANLGFGSINQVIINQAIATMHSNAGQWQLDKLTLPFKDGILKARARISLEKPQHPWQLTLMGDTMPAQILYRWLALPLPLTGAIDTQIKLNGYARSWADFNTHLTGSANVTSRQLALNNITPQQLLAQWQQPNFTVENQPAATPSVALPLQLTTPPLILTAHDGTIQLSPSTITGNDFRLNMMGQWNFTTAQQQQLQLILTTGCQQLTRSWHQGISTATVDSSCTGNTKYVPVNVDETVLPH